MVGAAALLTLGACPRPSAEDSWSLGPACPAAPVIATLDAELTANADADCALGGRLPPGWRAEPLFASGSPAVAALEQAPPPALRGFCSYTWSGEGEAQPAYAALRAALAADPHVHVDAAGPDCQGRLPRGTPTASTTAEQAVELARRDAFRLDVDWVEPARLGATAESRAPIEIAVADTVSAALAASPRRAQAHTHGRVVAAIIADLHCPDRRPGCQDQLRHTLAMPRSDARSAPDWHEGGDRGTRSDVALAVYHAVADWRARRRRDPQGTPPRLVLNLSLGLAPDPRASATLEPAPTQALRAALTYAACQGALVFAAAGNDLDRGDPQATSPSSGALEPARFEILPAPDETSCRAQGFEPIVDADYPVFGPARPLLYAVAGVDGNDRPLLNARPDSRPRLAAPALDGLAVDRDGALTPALSGSSIATAVTSGAAALLWSYRPTLRPDEIVDLLYDAGWDTGATAALGAEAAPIHRLSVCGALAQACVGQDPQRCPPLDCRAAAPDGRGHRKALAAALDAMIADP